MWIFHILIWIFLVSPSDLKIYFHFKILLFQANTMDVQWLERERDLNFISIWRN